MQLGRNTSHVSIDSFNCQADATGIMVRLLDGMQLSRGTAIGREANANAGVAVGLRANGSAPFSVVIGADARAFGSAGATVVGHKASASGPFSVAVGKKPAPLVAPQPSWAIEQRPMDFPSQ